MAKKTTKKTTKTVKKPVDNIQQAYANQTKADQKILKQTKKTFQMDNPYDKISKSRSKANKYIGVTNPTDRIAKTPTEHVYSVNKHYKQAISGVQKNAHAMAHGQRMVNNAIYKVTKGKAEREGADANHQNDVRYTQAKHQVAADSATTRNKLSVNHSQNLNKITTNTSANVANAKATRDKANLNTLENYYKFKTSTLKDMRVNRLTATQKQRQYDKQAAQEYKSNRIQDRQAIVKNKKAYKENKKELNASLYGAKAEAKITSVAGVNKAIKKMKASKDKNKTRKLTELYKLKSSLMTQEAAAKAASGGSGGGRRGGRGRSGRRGYSRSGGRSTSLYTPNSPGNTSSSSSSRSSGGRNYMAHKSPGNMNLYSATSSLTRNFGKGVNGLNKDQRNGRIGSAERTYVDSHGGGVTRGHKGGGKSHHKSGKKKFGFHINIPRIGRI